MRQEKRNLEVFKKMFLQSDHLAGTSVVAYLPFKPAAFGNASFSFHLAPLCTLGWHL